MAKDKVEIQHRAFLIKGFILSGKLYFAPMSDEEISNYGLVDIPDDQLERVYKRLLLNEETA